MSNLVVTELDNNGCLVAFYSDLDLYVVVVRPRPPHNESYRRKVQPLINIPEEIRGDVASWQEGSNDGSILEVSLRDGCFPDDKQRALRVRVYDDGVGINVEALSDSGQELGGVTLDYFDDRLRGLIFAGEDQPLTSADICPAGVRQTR